MTFGSRLPVRGLSAMAAPAGVAVAAAGACCAILLADPTTPGGLIPVCPTKLLGFTCPGCGSMRMIYTLLHGDVLGAARFNALGLVALVLLLWAFVAWTFGRYRGVFVRSWQHARWAPMIVLVVVLAWFAARNVPVPPFTALAV
jgi:hypothetical protein